MLSSALIGKWTFVSGENVNDYLKELGMALFKRKSTINTQPNLIISNPYDNVWCIAIDMKTRGTETLFKENDEVDTSNEMKFVFDSRFYFDARRVTKSKFKFETPNKLIQNMNFVDTEEKQIITREVNDQDQLIETLEMNGVTAVRTFKRS